MPCPHYQPTESGPYCKLIGTYTAKSAESTYCKSETHWKTCGNITGSCFLTTACVHYAGLPDDCKELTGMRNFRDGYLLSLPNGQAMYDEYYRLAPAIVEAIERSRYLDDILARVRQCVQFYDNGNSEAALDTYLAMFNELKNKFVQPA